MHCEDPGCLKACPAPGAIVQYANGIVDFISENCIGCGYCVKGCPFNIPRISAVDRKSYKCTLCSDRVAVGLEPACVKACPTGAIMFGSKTDMNNLGGRAHRGSEIARLRQRGALRSARRRRHPRHVCPASRRQAVALRRPARQSAHQRVRRRLERRPKAPRPRRHRCHRGGGLLALGGRPAPNEVEDKDDAAAANFIEKNARTVNPQTAARPVTKSRERPNEIPEGTIIRNTRAPGSTTGSRRPASCCSRCRACRCSIRCCSGSRACSAAASGRGRSIPGSASCCAQLRRADRAVLARQFLEPRRRRLAARRSSR